MIELLLKGKNIPRFGSTNHTLFLLTILILGLHFVIGALQYFFVIIEQVTHEGIAMNLHIIDHPLIHHKLALLRDGRCAMPEFKILLHEIGLLMAYEVTRDLPTEEITIETPVSPTTAHKLTHHPVLVTILRAGIGLLEPFMEILPLPHDNTFPKDSVVKLRHILETFNLTPETIES